MNAPRTRRFAGALLTVLASLCAPAVALAGPPMPPALPAIVAVTIGDSAACDTCSPHVCATQPISVQLAGLLPSPCWTYLGTQVLLPMTPGGSMSPFGPTIVRAIVRDPCPGDLGCAALVTPFYGAVRIGAFPPGSYQLDVQLAVQSCADSNAALKIQSRLLAFRVDSCQVPEPNCVYSLLQPEGGMADSIAHCALTLPPHGTGSLLFDSYVAGAPVAGLQGSIGAQSPLTVIGIESAVPAPGVHVEWRPVPYGAKWTLFADQGAPIQSGLNSLLRVTVRADSALAPDSMVIPRPQIVYVTGSVEAAADSNGNHVNICYIPTFAMVGAQVCLVPAEGCDVNLDGRVDVADLVRTVRCWYRPWSCPDSALARPDCTGDGAFHLDDVMCCARRALGEMNSRRPVPPGALSIAFEPAVDLGGGVIEAPLVIHGATEMDGALLRLVYPVDRYELAADPAGGDAGGAGWIPLSEPGAGEVMLGLLRLDTSAAGDIRIPVRLRLRPGQSAGGSLQVGEGSVIAPDGSTIAIDLSRVSAPLSATWTDPNARVELSRPMPNPSSGETRFDITLPAAAAAVDLAIYDVAGRRVATLWHGALQAGRRAFTWNPDGAHGGVYFARLVVNGQVRASRLTLQGSR